MIQTLFGSTEEKPSFLDRMKEAVTRTRENLAERIESVVSLGKEIDRGTLDNLEATLLGADLGTATTHEVLGKLREKADRKQIKDGHELKRLLQEELLAILRAANNRPVKRVDGTPWVILVVGVNGTGKTTTIGKLAQVLRSSGKTVLLCAADTFRAAAIEQLEVWGERTGTEVIRTKPGGDPAAVLYDALQAATARKTDYVLVDTAGRLHIDDELMNEMQSLKKLLNPSEILFVADAMTGQDAVHSAGEFHKQLALTGIVLTKMDGDARGGAALSIRKVTGAPVKFAGVGEKYDALEAFHPDRIVSRILGMGDVLTLIEKAEKTIDEKQAREMHRKLRENDFTLEDFRDQLRQIRKMGSLEQLMGMLPKIGPFAKLPKDVDLDDKQLKRVEAIINSMTANERSDHNLIDGKRRKRIARGSGTSVQEVNQVLKQYGDMRRMLKQYGNLAKSKIRGIGKFAGMKPPV